MVESITLEWGQRYERGWQTVQAAERASIFNAFKEISRQKVLPFPFLFAKVISLLDDFWFLQGQSYSMPEVTKWIEEIQVDHAYHARDLFDTVVDQLRPSLKVCLPLIFPRVSCFPPLGWLMFISL